MAHSLEVRVPFLDHHVVEFCASIPPHHKVRRLDTKHVLKRAVRGMIPDKIIDKPKVGFFNRAVNDWFRSQAAGAVGDYLLSPNARYAEILERKHVESLLPRRGQAQPAAATRALLPILMLEVWLSSYLEKATAPPTQSWEPVAV
jgi:asparagine synthase (glutamine-hydrolysing)